MKIFRQSRLSLYIASLLALFPIVVFAQFGTLGQTITEIGLLITKLIPVIVALALLYFFWGLAKFILNADNEQARTEGKQIMIWGIIALLIMVSVWAIVVTLQNTFFLGNLHAPDIAPLVPHI